MKTLIRLALLLCATISLAGCRPAANVSNNGGRPASTADSGTQLDFDGLLADIDRAIGKRLQSMQMEGMESASYQYDGPMETVVDIVAPVAQSAGFLEESDSDSDDADTTNQMMNQMGMQVKSLEQRNFAHPNGDMLVVSKMDIANDDVEMHLLAVHYMNPTKMPGMAKPKAAAAETPDDVQSLVDSWASMGMYLPDQQQIDSLHESLSDVAPELRAALSHEDANVRQRAAYVIAEIGPDARALGDSVLLQLKKEKEQLVQIYLIDALGATGYRDDDTIDFLETKYVSLNDENVPASLFSGGTYAEVDEKINLAGTLYTLADTPSKQPYLDFVVQWLAPPNGDLNGAEKSGYWDRRWMAVNTLEAMQGADAAIPLLEAMLEEDKTKPWVSVHVPRVLSALKQQ